MKIPVTLNTDTRYLPSCWDDVTFDQLLQLRKMESESNLTGIEKAVRIISILTGFPTPLLEEAGLGVVIPIYEQLEFLKTPISPAPTSSVTVLGEEYHRQSLETTGEFIAFSKISHAFPSDTDAQLPYLMALFLRKKVKQPVYKRLKDKITGKKSISEVVEPVENDMEWMESRAKLFRQHLSVTQVKDLEAFFLTNTEALRIITQSYSGITQLEPMLNELSAVLSGNDTAGWRPSTIWNRMYLNILRFWLYLYRWCLKNSSTSGK